MRSTSLALLAAGLCLSTSVPALSQSPAEQPGLTSEQAAQLFEEAGFPLQDRRPVNRCGAPSNPRVGFIDLNGDGRAEAHIADVAPDCYGKPGAYFAILAQQADGRWTRLIGEDGIVGFRQTRNDGWNDLSLEPRDSACPGIRRYNGTNYGPPTGCGTFAAFAASAKPAPAAKTANGPLSQEKLFDWSNDQLPEARDLPVAERDALFRAAGIQPVGGGKWTGCPDDPSGSSEAQVTMMRDLNGDGRPEAAILDGGTFCNGHAGARSVVLTRAPAGSWQIVYANQGFVNFLVSRGADGFPDIEAGLPGFCFPYFRWSGTEYALVAKLNKEGQACEPY